MPGAFWLRIRIFIAHYASQIGNWLTIIGLLLLATASVGSPAPSLKTRPLKCESDLLGKTKFDVILPIEKRKKIAAEMVKELNKFWQTELSNSGITFKPATLILASEGQTKGYGLAVSKIVHSYEDEKIYFTLNSEATEDENNPIVLFTILAHEYGHHIQDLLGVSKIRDSYYGYETGLLSLGPLNHQNVLYELQADAFSGFALAKMNPDWSEKEIQVAVETTASVGDEFSSHRDPQDNYNYGHGAGVDRMRAVQIGIEYANRGLSLRDIPSYSYKPFVDKYNLATEEFVQEMAAANTWNRFYSYLESK